MLSQVFLGDHSTPRTGHLEMRRENNTIVYTPNAILECPKFDKDHIILHQYSLYLYCLKTKRFDFVSMPGSNERCPGLWLSEHFFEDENVLRMHLKSVLPDFPIIPSRSWVRSLARLQPFFSGVMRVPPLTLGGCLWNSISPV